MDPAYYSNKYLSKIEAYHRGDIVSDVSYQLVLGLLKGGKTFNGKVRINYSLNQVSGGFVEGGDNSKCMFIDYKGKYIKSLAINGAQVDLK